MTRMKNAGFGNKSPVHLVAHKNVTIGVIKKLDREMLYKAYPTLKKKM